MTAPGEGRLVGVYSSSDDMQPVEASQLGGFFVGSPAVDLLRDAPLQPYYRRFGMIPVPGTAVRNPAACTGEARP